jgi:hypothetical protein
MRGRGEDHAGAPGTFPQAPQRLTLPKHDSFNPKRPAPVSPDLPRKHPPGNRLAQLHPQSSAPALCSSGGESTAPGSGPGTPWVHPQPSPMLRRYRRRLRSVYSRGPIAGGAQESRNPPFRLPVAGPGGYFLTMPLRRPPCRRMDPCST